MDLLTERDDWYRVGGRRINFVATYVELQELIDDCLHASEGPWRLTGADLVKPEGALKYEQVSWLCDHTQLEACPGPRGRRLNAWLWSEQWTPALRSAMRVRDYELVCAWNGLIGLQRLSATHQDGCEVSLHLVDKVRDRGGRGERAYPEYRRVFERLRRRVRSSVVAATLTPGVDGNTWEDDTTRWLSGAVQAYRAGGDLPLRPAL